MEWNIHAYGAVGDGITVCTHIIQECIDGCSRAGGGTVIIDQGVFISGTIYMKKNVTLEITSSATLMASPHISDYSMDTHHNRYRNESDLDRCWIYAEDQENFCIRGMGRIDGNAEAFPNAGSIYRPMMFRFLRCRRIRLEGLKLYNSPAWTTAFLDSSYIWVRDIEIKNEKRYNGDGLDFDGCSHVFVEGCSITGTDDNLCLQSSSREYPVKDIHITNCTFTSLCAGIRIGLKSIGDIHSVVINNCTMENVWREGIKIECTEGGNISDICVNNITMCNVTRPIFVILNNRFMPEDLGSSIELEKMPMIGTMSRLMFTNIIAVDRGEMEKAHYRFDDDIMGSPQFNGIRIDAEENHKITDVVLENIRYTAIGGVKLSDIPKGYPRVLDQLQHPGKKTSENYFPDWSRTANMDIRNVEDLYLSNVGLKTLYADERPFCLVENCSIRKQEIFV